MITSCEDFLDVKPTNQADSSTSVENAKDAQVMLNGIIRKLSSSSFYGRNFILYGDTKGGDLTIESQGRGMDGLYVFNHSSNSGSYSGFWSQGYHCIMQTNNLIENIDRLKEGGNNDLDEYKAQALTIRAMLHFDLCRLYGKSYNDDKNAWGVPVVTSLLSASAQPLRESVDNTYKQVLVDLDEAAPSLSKDVKQGYFNYYANRALKARVLLNMDDYAGALACAKEIIDCGVYELYSNSDWGQSWSKQWGEESILEIGMYDNEGDLGKSSLGAYFSKGKTISTSPQYFMASNYFLARLGEDMDDIRWCVMGEDDIAVNQSIERLGSCYKYLGGTSMTGDGKASSTAVNIKLIRLSEIYLIAAECALQTDKQAAADYLNAIRKRSPNLAPATASTVSLQMILDEKSKEFFGEGLRFFDLIRTNQTITFDDETPGIDPIHREKTIDRTFFKTILPISQDDINTNPGLADQQNPGY
jgi:SusD family.